MQHYGYSAFGDERYKHSSVAFDITSRYTGQGIDEETGLYFYQSRYYDPELGRFVQADTIVPSSDSSQALNRYAYVINNPLKFSDPTGHDFMDTIKKWVGTIVSVALNVLIPGAGFLTQLAFSAIGSAVSAAVNGGTFKSFLAGMGISLAAWCVASAVGGYIGFGDGTLKGFGNWAHNNPFTAGAFTGAVSGAISSVVYGGNWGQNIGEGAMSGLIGAGVAKTTEAIVTPLKAWVEGEGVLQELTPVEPVPARMFSELEEPEPVLSFTNFGSKVNLQGGIDYDLSETNAIIERWEKWDWDPLYHKDNGLLDFRVSNAQGHYTIKEFGRIVMLSASEFGNYLAGYLSTYHLGSAGYCGARIGGNLAATGGLNAAWGDDILSIRDITRGAYAATANHLFCVAYKINPIMLIYSPRMTYRAMRVLWSEKNAVLK